MTSQCFFFFKYSQPLQKHDYAPQALTTKSHIDGQSVQKTKTMQIQKLLHKIKRSDRLNRYQETIRNNTFNDRKKFEILSLMVKTCQFTLPPSHSSAYTLRIKRNYCLNGANICTFGDMCAPQLSAAPHMKYDLIVFFLI